jgi:hypothetical protein
LSYEIESIRHQHSVLGSSAAKQGHSPSE